MWILCCMCNKLSCRKLGGIDGTLSNSSPMRYFGYPLLSCPGIFLSRYVHEVIVGGFPCRIVMTNTANHVRYSVNAFS